MYYLIVNVSSGSGKGKKTFSKVREVLASRNIEYKAYKTERLAHATEIATKICELEDDDKRIIVVGGDGSINEVLNGIKDFSKVKLGVVPTGSGNDFVRGHSIKGSTEEILTEILDNTAPKMVDIGEVKYDGTSRLFGISAGLGLDALVCKKAITSKLKKVLNKIGLGKLTYGMLTVSSLFTMKTYSLQTKADESDAEYTKAIFTAAMILRTEGGGVPMAPTADMTDGKLSICTAANVSKFRAFLSFPALLAGKHSKKKAFALLDTKEYEIKADSPQVLHADGEYLGEVTEAKLSVRRKALALLNKNEES